MRRNKLQITLLALVLCLSTGCHSGPKETIPEFVFVTFKDFDDSVLLHERIPYGTVASYSGETPLRDMTIDKVYTFSGWDKSLNQPLYENTIFNAKYVEEVRKYVVSFNNYDGTLLQRINVDYGTTAKYTESTPIKQSNDEHIEYTFSGWDKNINTYTVSSDTTFTAQFATTEYVFATFNNYDGTQLLRSKVVKGRNATYSGSTPIKNSDDERFEYTFSGWDKSLTNLNIDTTFTAQYSTTEFVFTTFNNYDGTQLLRSKVKKGGNATYTGSTPTRSYSGSDKVYRFSGWDKSLFNLSVDTTFTAQFDLLNLYTVTFKNYDGTVLQTVKVVHGDDAVYTGSTPYRSSTTSGDYRTTYTFSGWSQSTKNVTSNLTVTAQFTTSTTVTGATAIRNHLDRYGSGSYHNVETNSGYDWNSTLGYSGSYFYMGYTNTSSMESYMAVSCTYGSSSGTGAYQLYDSGVLMFSANYTIYFSNHAYSDIYCTSIKTNRYTTDSQLASVAALTILAARFAVNYANEYCSDNGLPYVF
ncbi:MAG: hypothetical protein H6688_02085 [Erysipelotrichaceae bacterium]|nr:hypothetical protein [Erysipelotrichaceae bacterium]